MNNYKIFNNQAYRQALDKNAKNFAKYAIFQREVANNLLQKLDLMRVQPQRILDLGAKTGYTTQLLRKKYPKAEVIAADLSPLMLQQNKRQQGWWKRQSCVCISDERLPFTRASFDLVFANFFITRSNDLKKIFSEIFRVISKNGLFIFSALGPNSLHELQASWKTVDSNLHVHPFIDMHDIGDMLMHTGFIDPVMEMEYFTLTYYTAEDFFRDLKKTGATNILNNRHPGLTGKNKFKNFLLALEKYRNADNLLPATMELIYGHAWTPQRQTFKADAQGEVSIKLSDIKNYR